MKRAITLLVAALAGCTSPQAAAPQEPVASQSAELRVDVQGRTLVRLDPPGVVGASDPWDLAFEGYNVFTNSGPSGPGQGSAFGPLDPASFDEPVAIPFTEPDRPGGAFLDWYFYEGAPAHVLWSRFHVQAVRDGDRLWKIQILGYYGKIDGAPVSALYRVRYAELTEQGEGPTTEIDDLDASAGGTSAPPDAPSACLDLATGQRAMLTPAESLASAAWHLCFRRQSIFVNGGQSGPRGATALDLDASEQASEELPEVKARTAEGEQARFAAVKRADLAGKVFEADGVKSIFGGSWVERPQGKPEPRPATWVVVGADGKQRFKVVFARFEGASEASPGSVFLRIKPDSGENK